MTPARLVRTRRTFVQRLKNIEDQESWREFFDTYWKLIYSFARKRGCTEDEAEEVVQETIISLARKMPEFRYDPAVCSFRGWLLHVTNRRAIDQVRKRKYHLAARHPHPEDHSTGPAIEPTVQSVPAEFVTLWQDEWEKNLIDAALDRVRRRAKPLHFQIFYLLMLEDQSVSEVARALDVSRAQIYLAKHRVGALLKREISVLEKTWG